MLLEQMDATRMLRWCLSRNTPVLIYLTLIGVYFALVDAFTLANGGGLAPTTFLLLLLLCALVILLLRTRLRDVVPLVLIFYGWQLLRPFSAAAGRGAAFVRHGEQVISLESKLFGGHIPTLALQHAWYTPGNLHWYDYAATFLYGFHFLLPVAFSLLLWFRDQALFRRFLVTLLVVSLASYVTYMIFPTTPPWMASEMRLLHPASIDSHVRLIRQAVFGSLSTGDFPSSLMNRSNDPDAIAAMPSLHAAYPTIALVTCAFHYRKLVPIALLYCLSLWLSIVYIGDHYVVDIVVGVVYATIGSFGVRILWGKYIQLRRSAALSEQPLGRLETE